MLPPPFIASGVEIDSGWLAMKVSWMWQKALANPKPYTLMCMMLLTFVDVSPPIDLKWS